MSRRTSSIGSLLLAVALAGCVSYERAHVVIDGKSCVEPPPPVVSGQEVHFASELGALEPAEALGFSPSAGGGLSVSPRVTRIYTLGQALLFLQSALFQLCLGAANGTISPKDHARLVGRVISEAGELMWLEGDGPFDETVTSTAP